MAQYPFNIDVSTVERQLEVLRLWGIGTLDTATASLILKVPPSAVLEVASGDRIEPPNEVTLKHRIQELEARIRPELRRRKRDQGAKDFVAIWASISGLLDLVASIDGSGDMW